MTTSAELRSSFDVARDSMDSAMHCAKVAVRFSAGKLRHMYLDQETLRDLKRELQGFNSKTGKWIRN